MLDAAPGNVGDVKEAVESVEIDERAEVGDVFHAALAHFALGEAFEKFALALFEVAFDEFAAGNDDVAALVGDLDDLAFERLADVGGEIAHGRNFNLRAGQERLDSVDIHEEAAAHLALDEAGHDASFGVLFENRVPADLLVCAGLGNHDHAGLVVFERHEHDGEFQSGLDIGAFFLLEFGKGDCALGVVADVHENVVAFYRRNRTLDDGAGSEFRRLVFVGACEELRHQGGLFGRRGRLADCHCFCFSRPAGTCPGGRLLGFMDRGRERPACARP